MHAKSIKYEYPSLKNSYFMLLDRGKLAVNNPLLIYNLPISTCVSPLYIFLRHRHVY